jgi:hypothetical protein
MDEEDKFMFKVIAILMTLVLLKILITQQSYATPQCPICVEELPPTNHTICVEKYGVGSDNIDECMWLLENQPALQ